MSEEPWVEDENHRTINGVKWVARKCIGCCGVEPDCELISVRGCNRYPKGRICSSHERKDGRSIRWYRSDSPALAFFGKPNMIVNVCRGADERWIVYVDGRMAPISPCRQRRSAILLAREASFISHETMHKLLAMDAREEAVQ